MYYQLIIIGIFFNLASCSYRRRLYVRFKSPVKDLILCNPIAFKDHALFIEVLSVPNTCSTLTLVFECLWLSLCCLLVSALFL